MMSIQLLDIYLMGFSTRLLKLRKAKGLTQQALADKSEMHVVQIRRYETDVSQPSLEAIRKLAVALGTSSDALVFDDAERGPDDDLRLQFEAVSRLQPQHKEVVKEVIEGMIIKYEAEKWRVL